MKDKDQPAADQQYAEMWGFELYAIGGGFPALELFHTEAEARSAARKYNDKEDWVTSEVQSVQVAPGLFDGELYPVTARPAQLIDRWRRYSAGQ